MARSTTEENEYRPRNAIGLELMLRRIRSADVSDANKATLERFALERIHAVKSSTIATYLDALIPLGRLLGPRDYSDAERVSLIEAIATHVCDSAGKRHQHLAATTKYQWATHYRTFYRWLLPEARRRLPTHDLPFKKIDSLVHRAVQLALEPGEIRLLLRAASCVRDRAIILVLLETGFRASELAALDLNSLRLRPQGYRVQLPVDAPNLKTGVRQVPIPIIASAPALDEWLAEHPNPSDPNGPLFTTMSHRSYGRRVSGRTVGEMVTRTGRRAGIARMHAHRLRHTSATFKVAYGMNPVAIRLIHGWSPRSTMLGYYTHAQPHFEQMMLKAYDLEPDEPALLDIMGSRPCPSCGAKAFVADDRCPNCGLLLVDALIKSEADYEQQIESHFAFARGLRALGEPLFAIVAALLNTSPRPEDAA